MRVATINLLAACLAFASAQTTTEWDFTSHDASYNISKGVPEFTVNWTTVAETCVSPAEFNKCQLGVTTQTYQPCITKCPQSNLTTIEAGDLDPFETCWAECSCELYSEQLNCALEYCWNQVYGCEYQKTALNVVNICADSSTFEADNSTSTDPADSTDDDSPIEELVGSYYAKAGVPYFPAPADAPGSCSCNLVSAYTAVTLQIYAGSECASNDTTGSISQTCGCCVYSGAYSALQQICPDTSAFDIGIDWLVEYSLANFSTSQCANPSVPPASCVADEGFYALPDNSTSFLAYNALTSASAKATGTLSALSGQVTSPASGYTVTWSVNKTPYTVTATSATVKPESSTSSSGTTTGSARSSVSGSATATTSGSAATGSIGFEAAAIAAGLVAVVIGL